LSLRDIIRSSANENEIIEAIGAAVKRKKSQHAGISSLILNSHKNAVT
jgi:hypothetical protein